jgi:hypothetical protein
MDNIKIFREYLVRVTESANKPHISHKEQLIKSFDKLIHMFEEQEKIIKQHKHMIQELNGCLEWHVEAVEKYEKVLEFYSDKENYEEWNEDSGLTEYIHTVDFDGGDKAREVLGINDSDR